MKSNYEDPLEEATHREEARRGLELALTSYLLRERRQRE